jgi:hypothetical protein
MQHADFENRLADDFSGAIMSVIDQYSVATVPIEMFFRETLLSMATGFVWKDRGQFLLITNWHNVSGIDPFSRTHISRTAAEPDRIRVWWNRKGQLGEKFATIEILRGADGAPLWWVHPQHGDQVDVIALPVKPHTDAEMYPINRMPSAPLLASVGAEVFVLATHSELGPAAFQYGSAGALLLNQTFSAPISSTSS